MTTEEERARLTTAVVVHDRGPMTMETVQMMKALSTEFINLKGQAIPRSIQTPQMAMAIMTLGHELGIQPMTAFANIAVINGVTQPMAQLMMGVTRARDPSARFTFPKLSLEEGVTCCLMRDSFSEPICYSATLDTVPKAIQKNVWLSHPLDMLTWYCVKRVCRLGASDLIMVGAAIPGIEVEEEAPVTVSEAPRTFKQVTEAAAAQLAEEVDPADMSEPLPVAHVGEAKLATTPPLADDPVTPAMPPEPVEAKLEPAPAPEQAQLESAPSESTPMAAEIPEDEYATAIAGVNEALKTHRLKLPGLLMRLNIANVGANPLYSGWMKPARDGGMSWVDAAVLAVSLLDQVQREIKGGASPAQAVIVVDPQAQLAEAIKHD